MLRTAVPAAVEDAGVDPEDVVGIATDFTASTPLPTLADGTPLCETPEFRGRPHAYPKLWKHHAAQAQADRITALAAERNEPWLARYGGMISSEWEYAKALQVLEEDAEVYDAMDRWIEARRLDRLGAVRRGDAQRLHRRLQGHPPGRRATPPRTISPPSTRASRASRPTSSSTQLAPLGGRAGSLTAEAAEWTGLPEGIAVAVGNVDAHVTVPAAQAIEPGTMVAIMGTSTCHVMNGEEPVEVPGMCGAVLGGITPGLWGFEAGQSGVGDIFGWFVDHLVGAEYHEEAERRGISLHAHLSELAAEQEVGEHGLVALDWESGNRSVLVDHDLSGVIVGLTLGTRPPDIYRALVEATAFGARKIVETFEDAGVPVDDFVVAGGLLKNQFVMQIYADVLRRPLHLIGSDQGPALGSAIHAAVAAGAHPDVHAAAAAMGKLERDAYAPDARAADAYDELYTLYTRLHDHFGRDDDDLMHRLRRPLGELVN